MAALPPDQLQHALARLQSWLNNSEQCTPTTNGGVWVADKVADALACVGHTSSQWVEALHSLPPGELPEFLADALARRWCAAATVHVVCSALLVLSRRRDCHSAAPPSPFIRCFNTDEEGGATE